MARQDAKTVTIRVNGKPVTARAGQTLAGALWADGRRVLSRSMRYHRARGLFCGTGECTHCFLRVDGVPNVRACRTPCRDGLWAEDQNAWPSVEHDVLAASDVVYPNYLDAHKAFIRPRFLKPLFTRVIRGMAGFGKVPKDPVPQRYDQRRRQPDVLVVGAGPSGLAAAEAAADAGADVLLLDREDRVGGRLAWTSRMTTGEDPAAWVDARRDALSAAGAETMTQTRLLGLYADEGLVAASPTALVRIHADRVILATGSRDAYPVFPGSDRAGVLLAAAAARLLHRDGVLPGKRPVLVGATDAGLGLAADLTAAGARVEEVHEPRQEVPAPALGRAEAEGLTVRSGHVPERTWGRKAFDRIRFRTATGYAVAEGDVLVLATGRVARAELGQQAGCRLTHRPGHGFVVDAAQDGRTNVDGVYAAGSVAGAEDLEASIAQGRAAGRAAA